MSYCAVADIQNDFKALTIGASTNVTTSAVTQFIVEASALIDSYVAQRWVTPITADATSLALMSLFCRTLVADRIRGIIANKQQTNTDPNQAVKSDGYSTKNVMQALNDIRIGNMQLTGATLLLANAGFVSRNNQQGEQPVFHKNRKQW